MKRKPQPEANFSLYALAKDELQRWNPSVRGIALAVLFCFIHRLTTGKSYEESFCSKENPRDWTGYEI